MASKEKKKSPFWKRILKWFGGFILLLLIVIISIPFLFKDQIIELIKTTANDNLNATLDFGEADLTFLSTFPNLTLTINDLTVEGKDDFEGLQLANIKTTTLKLDFWEALFGDQYQVDEVILDNPILYVKVLPNGKANYDIAISDTTAIEEVSTEPSSPFKFALEHYKIINGDITYDDQYYLTYINLSELNHEGNVSIDDVIYNLNTTTKAGHLTFGYDSFNYLENSNADINCNLEIAMPEDEMKLTFKENDATLNQLKLHFDGSMLMKDDFMDFDFTFNTLDQTFKSLLSIVPGAFTEDFNSISTDGQIDLEGSLKGKYSDTDMPGFNLRTVIENAWLKYPDLPEKLNNINMDLVVSREAGPDLDNLIVDLKKLNLEFIKNKIGASLYLTHPMGDPNIKAEIMSNLDLAELKKVIPMEEGDDYSGIIESDVQLKGKLSSIENEQYDQFDASGNLSIQDMNYQTNSIGYPVSISKMLFEFSPEFMSMTEFNANLGESDIALNGKFINYLGYILKGDTIQGVLNFNSNKINLDQLMYSEASSEGTESASTEVAPIDSALAEVFDVPDNVDFKLSTSIADMIYDGTSLKNVGGSIILKNGQAILENLHMNIFDGNIVLNGKYEALSPKLAQTNFSYDIQNLDFQQAFNYFTSIQRYASIAKYCQGKFSTKMSLETQLDEFYYPIYQSLTGIGDLKSSKVEIVNHPLFDKIAENLKTIKNPLQNQAIENLNLSFSFEEGRLKIKETPIKMGKINSSFVGSTGFDQTLDYDWKTQFPSELLGDAAQGVANELLGKLNNAAGTNVTIPKTIPINFKIGGTVTNPTLTSDLKNSGQDVKQNLIDQGKDLLNEEAKKILADAQAQIDKILADAKEQADKIRNEANAAAEKIEKEADAAHEKAYAETAKQAEKLKKEGYDAAQKLIDEAKNPVAKLAAEKTATKMREETDKKVSDLESKANKEADDAKATAYKKADQIRNEGETKASQIEGTAQTQSDKIMTDANDKVDKMTE